MKSMDALPLCGEERGRWGRREVSQGMSEARFVARQPIFAEHQNVAGYELLFRAGRIDFSISNRFNDQWRNRTLRLLTQPA
jgi:hypothetical protein